MAEILTAMDPTRLHFVAGHHAQMPALRIASSAHFTLDRTADLLALVFATLFDRITHPFALEIIHLVNFLLSHELFAN